MSITHLNSPFIQVGCAKPISRVDGTPIQVGDTITVYLQDNSKRLSGFPTANLIVVRLSEDRRAFVYDRRVAGQDFRFDDIAEIHPQHSTSCPVQCSYSLVFTAPVTAFTIGGVSIPLSPNPSPLTEEGAAGLKLDIQQYLDAVHPQTSPLPSVSVVFIPDVDIFAGGNQPAFAITISATVLPWDSVNNEFVPEQSCPTQVCDYNLVITQDAVTTVRTQTQNPIPLPNYPYAQSLADANQLESDLNAFLAGNGSAVVGFIDNASPALRKMIINISGTNVQFVNVNNGISGQVTFSQSNCR